MRYLFSLVAIALVANVDSIARPRGGAGLGGGGQNVGRCGQTTGLVLASRASNAQAFSVNQPSRVLAPAPARPIAEPLPVRPSRSAATIEAPAIVSRPPVVLTTAGLQLAATDSRYVGGSGGRGGQYYNSGRGGRRGGGGLFGLRGRR